MALPFLFLEAAGRGETMISDGKAEGAGKLVTFFYRPG